MQSFLFFKGGVAELADFFDESKLENVDEQRPVEEEERAEEEEKTVKEKVQQMKKRDHRKKRRQRWKLTLQL